MSLTPSQIYSVLQKAGQNLVDDCRIPDKYRVRIDDKPEGILAHAEVDGTSIQFHLRWRGETYKIRAWVGDESASIAVDGQVQPEARLVFSVRAFSLSYPIAPTFSFRPLKLGGRTVRLDLRVPRNGPPNAEPKQLETVSAAGLEAVEVHLAPPKDDFDADAWLRAELENDGPPSAPSFAAATQKPIKVLFVHGVGFPEDREGWDEDDKAAIKHHIRVHRGRKAEVNSLEYDEFFRNLQAEPDDYADALEALIGSWWRATIKWAVELEAAGLEGAGLESADSLAGRIKAKFNATAGLVVLWRTNEEARNKAVEHLAAEVRNGYDLVVADSLGSLLAYEALSTRLTSPLDIGLLTSGSQIFHPANRESFSAPPAPLDGIRHWSFLHNPSDMVFAMFPPAGPAPNLSIHTTPFSFEMVNHNFFKYIDHPEAATAWDKALP